MARNTSRKDDWTRFLLALIGDPMAGEKLRHTNPVINYFLTVGHTAKNIWIEEARRWGWELNPK